MKKMQGKICFIDGHAEQLLRRRKAAYFCAYRYYTTKQVKIQVVRTKFLAFFVNFFPEKSKFSVLYMNLHVFTHF